MIINTIDIPFHVNEIYSYSPSINFSHLRMGLGTGDWKLAADWVALEGKQKLIIIRF